MQPHHRRRRIVAIVAVGMALAAAVAGAVVAMGGTAHHPLLRLTNGYFGRLRTLAGNGPGSFVAYQRAVENAGINRTLQYTPYVRIAGHQHRELALTFDDGPGPYTPQVLATLVRYHVPATFFEVGIAESDFHVSTSALVADGFVIGDHTESHAPMSHLSAREQRAQLLQQSSRIARYGAPFPRLFRPPYGLWNTTTLKVLRKYHMLMVLWTVDTSDYRQPGVGAIVHAAVSGARPGAIILLHDAGGDRAQTVAALPRIIKALRARGYKFVTVPRLLADNPPPHNQHFSALVGSGG